MYCANPWAICSCCPKRHRRNPANDLRKSMSERLQESRICLTLRWSEFGSTNRGSMWRRYDQIGVLPIPARHWFRRAHRVPRGGRFQNAQILRHCPNTDIFRHRAMWWINYSPWTLGGSCESVSFKPFIRMIECTLPLGKSLFRCRSKIKIEDALPPKRSSCYLAATSNLISKARMIAEMVSKRGFEPWRNAL